MRKIMSTDARVTDQTSLSQDSITHSTKDFKEQLEETNSTLQNRAIIKRIGCYYKNQYNEDIEYYDKALEIDPKHVGILNNKGLAL